VTLLGEDGQVDRRVAFNFDEESDDEPLLDEAAGGQPLPAGVQVATPTNLQVLRNFVADAAAQNRLAAQQANQLPEDADGRILMMAGNASELRSRLTTLTDNFSDNKEQTAAYDSLVGDDAQNTIVSGEGAPASSVFSFI